MANTTQYKYSPRIFGKTGDQYLAMQPSAVTSAVPPLQAPMPQVAPLTSPTRAYGGPIPAQDSLYGDGSDSNWASTYLAQTGTVPTAGTPSFDTGETPAQAWQRTGKALTDIAAKAPTPFTPERFTGTIPNPTVLPPPATYNTDPAVNTLLKLYPWLSLFGGVRGASAVTTGAAEGIGIHAQTEDQRLAQQRAYQQQALDAQQQTQTKNVELGADTNRYYNQAGQQAYTGAIAEHKLQVGAAAAEHQRTTTVLNAGRRSVIAEIASETAALKDRNQPFEVWKSHANRIQQLRQELYDKYDGPAPGAPPDGLDNMTQESSGMLSILAQFKGKQKSDADWHKLRTDTDLAIAKASQIGQTERQIAGFKFEGKQRQLDRQVREKDINWHYYGIDADIYKTDVQRQQKLMELDTKLRDAAISNDQKTALTAYEKATTRFLQAQAQMNVITGKLDAFYKMAANAPHNWQPPPDQVAIIQGYEAQLPGLQQTIKDAGQDAKQYRELITLPAEQVPLPIVPGAPARPIPPQHPGTRGGDNGNRKEAGAGTGGGQPGGRTKPGTDNRIEKPGSRPPAKPTVETPQQRRDRLINRYAPK